MGLDICGKNDYYRFNWSGVAKFKEFHEEHGLPYPFPNFDGYNGSSGLNLSKPKDKQVVINYVKAVEEKFPEVMKFGYGELIESALWAGHSLGEKTINKQASKEELEVAIDDYWRHLTFGWYKFLKESLSSGDEIHYQ